MKFKKVLIANRGEIAVRILRTCKELGIQTVCVHSEVDEESLHVKLADESVCIGPSRASLSYLNIPSVISAAEITGADAVHPGFGLLSENAEFVRACQQWNIAFIGPNPESMEKMGDKILSKKCAQKAGLPVLKTIKVQGTSEKDLLKKVLTLGPPVLIKASAGGGGRGMYKVERPEELFPAIARLEQEAKAAFGDGTLFIEKYIERPRHIEVQIWADQHGNVLHLGERDCTIQRRYQKLVEESPSPILSESKRKEICKSAVNLAKAVGYDSVGTVEFIYDQDTDKYYFMEMNTRIQVEHPVTEMRTGIDLVEAQILSALGEKIPFKQKDIQFKGHSVECRVNAEDPFTGAPSPGKIHFYFRPGGMGIRVDDFVYSGYTVSPYYDSMISKVIAHAEDRERCIKRMERALSEMIISGIKTNIELHRKVISDEDFLGNNYSTNFISEKLM